VFLVLAGRAVRAFIGAFDYHGVFDESHTGAKNFEPIPGDGDDRGFEANFARTTIEEEGSLVAESVADVLSRSGGEVGETVGARSRDGELGGAEKGEGHRMAGNSEANRGKAGGDFVGDNRFLRNNQGEWARPIFTTEALGFFAPVASEFASFIDGSDVDDERAVRGALLQFVNFTNGGRIEGIGSEPVDGFGGEDDEPSGTDDFCRFLNIA